MIDPNDDRLNSYERAIAGMRGELVSLSFEEAITYCALGLSEECGEAVAELKTAQTSLLEIELGDVLWHATTSAHRLDATISDLLDLVPLGNGEMTWMCDAVTLLHVPAARFAGRVKKWRYHDKPLDRQACLVDLGEIVKTIDSLFTLPVIEEASLSKIRKRFPSGGFSKLEANARIDEK